MNQYRVNPDSDVPIYQQLSDAIYADIKGGKLPVGTKLSTVREMSDQLQVARGTVKRAYDELEKMGAVEMTQGRGTYIRYRPETSDSRKERAMVAIEKMLNQLENLDISPVEAKIFIDLKLRERASLNKAISVALVECSPEVLHQLEKSMHKFKNVDTYQYLQDDILDYPYKIGEEMDIIVTSATHAKALENVIAEKGKVSKVAINLVTRSIMQLALLKNDQNVGIICQSMRFGTLLQDVCHNYAKQTNVFQPWLFDQGQDCGAYIEGKDVLLIPEGYQKFCSHKDAELIRKFGEKHLVVQCEYQIDQGSFMYLEERIGELQKRKGI